MFYQFGKKENIRDRMFMILTLLCTFIPLVVAAGFFILLGGNSSEAFRTFGFKFILSNAVGPRPAALRSAPGDQRNAGDDGDRGRHRGSAGIHYRAVSCECAEMRSLWR